MGTMDPTMDPLDFLDNEELLQLFHCNKTEMSCLENPHTFISQLRDHDLVPENTYKRMRRMKSKENLKKALYDLLDWLERERSQHIKLFWTSVFKETIMNHYPALRMLHNSLMDGSFDFGTQLPETVEKKKRDGGKQKRLPNDEESEEEEKEAKSVKQKRKLRSKTMCDDDDNEENAGPSTPVTPSQKKPKICSSTQKKGEKGDIWTWRFYKSHLPVSCGDQEGILYRGQLARRKKCILVDKQWFTPTGFERFACEQRRKNWRMNIQCNGTPLGKLIQKGHLKAVNYTGGREKSLQFTSDRASTVLEEEDDEDEECETDTENQVSSDTYVSDEEDSSGEDSEQQPEASQGSSKKVFQVTCGGVAATLHQKRFASGTRGKSIRTETSWMTPKEFAMEALGQRDVSWKKDIECEGHQLSVLTEGNILRIHSLLCDCDLCKPDSEDLEDEKNDDECCICKGGGNLMVMCDQCPRSFHQKCHLPHVEDNTLGDDSPWLCTFCVFRSNQQYFSRDELTVEAAMSRQISQHMLECQYLLLHLCCADDQTFAANPDLYLSDYSSVINTPMWLGKIADRLQEQLYETVGEFVSDVNLIFTNCASYNRDNAEFVAYGNRLKELFNGQFKNVFNIQ